MTAVEHAELKRLAEGATPGPWTTCVRMGGDAIVDAPSRSVARIDYRRDEASRDSEAAFIAAANPAVVLELLSEIEGLKAERDEANANGASHWSRAIEAERQLADLRTQALDSWRPIAEHDNSADEVLVMAEGWSKPIVAWRHHPSSRTDMWLTVPGRYQVKPTEFHPLPALRPQTAESGK